MTGYENFSRKDLEKEMKRLSSDECEGVCNPRKLKDAVQDREDLAREIENRKAWGEW